MLNYNPQDIDDNFKRLPESLKEEMMSAENSERIFQTGKKFALNLEQIGFLAAESGYVVLGLTHPKDFVTRLQERLQIDLEKAKKIALDINHLVFFPMRELLKNTHDFEITQEQLQTAQPMTDMLRVSASSPPSQPISPPPTAAPSPSPVKPITPTPPVLVKPSPTPAPSVSKQTSGRPTLEQFLQSPIKPASPLTTTETNATPPPSPPKIIDGMKPKEEGITQSQPSSDISSAPSQIMQSELMHKKVTEDKKHVITPSPAEIQRMKDSLFSPPTAPSASTAISSAHQPTPDQTPQIPSPPPATPPSAPVRPSPAPSRGSDPYREPIE